MSAHRRLLPPSYSLGPFAPAVLGASMRLSLAWQARMAKANETERTILTLLVKHTALSHREALDLSWTELVLWQGQLERRGLWPQEEGE